MHVAASRPTGDRTNMEVRETTLNSRSKYIACCLFTVVSLLPTLGRADSATVFLQVREDDAEEMSVNGNMLMVGMSLDLVDDKSKQQTVGLRYANFPVPLGARIDSAFIDMVVAAPYSRPASVSIWGEASDNALPLEKTNYNITSRPLTSAVTSWSSIPPWTVVGDTVTTPDVGPVLQEIVSRPGWALGNALAIIFTGTGQRSVESYDDVGPAGAPRLRVYYSNVPNLVMLKTVQTTSDPIDGSSNPKAIPGAELLYTLTATNYGMGAADSQSCVVTDAIPPAVMLFVGDLGGGGPLLFTDGATNSGLTYSFSSLSSTTDDLEFSSNGGLTFDYAPVPDVDGYDASVTHIRIHPQGEFAASDGISFPSFSISFRVRAR